MRVASRYIPGLGLYAAMIFLLGLTGCGSLLAADPPKLYVLTSPPVDPVQSGGDAVTVALPASPGGFDTPRIALLAGANRLDYFANAAWPDRVPLMIQGMLIDALRAANAFPAVERESRGLRAPFSLIADIKDFSAHYDIAMDHAPEIRFRLVVQLVRSDDRQVVEMHMISASQRAASNQIESIVTAFNQTSDRALAEAAIWTAGAERRARRSAGGQAIQ